jgi:hypothetical protein
MTDVERLGVGCAGALTPILANLLVVDLEVTLADLRPLTVASYIVRVLALCAAACIVVYLNSDETKAIKVFQLGIAAPALLVSLINGVQANHNSKKASVEFPFLTATAFAQDAKGKAAQGASQIADCMGEPEPTAGQQVIRGLFGILPDNRWFVVVGSDLTRENAISEANEVNQQGQFRAKVCAPAGGADKYYRVVIGEYMSRAEALTLRKQAANAGLPKDAWLWNPMTSPK